MEIIYDANETMRMIGESTAYTLISSEGEAEGAFSDILEARAKDETTNLLDLCIDVFTLGYIYGRKERGQK